MQQIKGFNYPSSWLTLIPCNSNSAAFAGSTPGDRKPAISVEKLCNAWLQRVLKTGSIDLDISRYNEIYLDTHFKFDCWLDLPVKINVGNQYFSLEPTLRRKFRDSASSPSVIPKPIGSYWRRLIDLINDLTGIPAADYSDYCNSM